jgi:predicted nuclease with TOPRIM domain
MEQLLKYWPVLLFVLNFLGIWVGWSVRKGVATQEDLKAHATEIRKELDDHSDETNRIMQDVQRRLTHVEASIQHGPSDDDLKRLHERLDDVSGEMKTLSGQFTGAIEQLRMLNQFLLEGGGKAK